MFLSKIWFFLLAVAAATAFTIAIVMPRPAGRDAIQREAPQLVKACSFTNILLQTNARARIDLTDSFSRAPGLSKVIQKAGAEDKVSAQSNSDAKQAIRKAIAQLEKQKVGKDLLPDFVYLVDTTGRVIAREGKQAEQKLYGKHSLAGYFAVDDALHGYIRDDLWVMEKNKVTELYRVAVAPIIRRGEVDKLVGAIVLGHELDVSFAKSLADKLNIDVNFYAKGQMVANSKAVQVDSDIAAAYDAAKWDGPLANDCAKSAPFTARDGKDDYSLLLARLPGEAGGAQKAYFAIYMKRAPGLGFSGTLDKVKKGDLSFKHFPWLGVGFLFLIAVGGGLALMLWESDLPLRRLSADAVAMAKGDTDRMSEDKHKGKFGSIARSVNIQLDKLARESKAAKKDLDQLLGPAPDGGLALKGGFDSSGGIGIGDDGPMFAPPPPPAEFAATNAPRPPAPPRTPAPQTPPPMPSAPAPAASPFDLDLPPPPPSIGDAAPKPPNTPVVASPTQAQVPPAPVSLPQAPPPPAVERTPPPSLAVEKPPQAPPPLPPSLPGAFDDDILAIEPDPEPAAKPKRAASDFDEPTRVAGPSEELLSASADADGDGFRQVFEDFVALKKKCGESTSSLTLEKFSRKLKKNRDTLIAKHNCKTVRFQVYEKNGKAALKATPVKS